MTDETPTPPARKKPGPKPKPEKPEPGLGRIVLYVTAEETLRPAIISRLNEESVDLTVFNSEGSSAVTNVVEDTEDYLPGTYHWPTR